MKKINELLTRIMSVAVWIGIIFLFLFSPNLTQLFKKESLNIFMWSGVVDPKLFADFEKKTGIHVNVSYYGGNEELIVKLLATKGYGYDMIVPSDYAVQFLINKNLLKKLDKTKLNFYEKIDPSFLGHYFDPKNIYSIPAEWYLLGLGINKNYFKDGDLPSASWATVFDVNKMPKNIGLINDSRELIILAMKYKYHKLRTINDDEADNIAKILQLQKQKAEAYTDFRGDFLLEAGNCPVVVISNQYAWKSVRDNKHLEFSIPKEGTFLNLENYVIPKTSTKELQVYKLMNFLFERKVQEHNFNEYSWLSTRKDADYMYIVPALKNSIKAVRTGKTQLFKNVLTDEQVNDIWLSVKGS